ISDIYRERRGIIFLPSPLAGEGQGERGNLFPGLVALDPGFAMQIPPPLRGGPLWKRGRESKLPFLAAPLGKGGGNQVGWKKTGVRRQKIGSLCLLSPFSFLPSPFSLPPTARTDS